MRRSSSVLHRVTLIPGDGIGPEVIDSARRAVEATGVEISWDIQDAGERASSSHAGQIPQGLIASVREHGVALKGPVATPPRSGGRSVNLTLREALGLELGIRPARDPARSRSEIGIDVVVARMLAGDLYGGLDYAADSEPAKRIREVVAGTGRRDISSDTAITLKTISRTEVERAARHLTGWARANGRRRITIVHKSTAMRATDGLFLDTARAALDAASDLSVDDRLVDAVCHDLVIRPNSYDVLFTPMLYGDLLSDLAAAIGGGLGMAPGMNLGNGCAVFEAVHGTAPRLAGTGRANPLAAIRSGAMMLQYLGESNAAKRLDDAVDEVARGGVVTYDLRPGREPVGAATTEQVTDAVVALLIS